MIQTTRSRVTGGTISVLECEVFGVLGVDFQTSHTTIRISKFDDQKKRIWWHETFESQIFLTKKILISLSNILIPSVIDMTILNSRCNFKCNFMQKKNNKNNKKKAILLFFLSSLVNGKFVNNVTWPWGISYISLKEVLFGLKTFPDIFCTLRKGSYVLLLEPKNNYMLWSSFNSCWWKQECVPF